MIEITKNDAKLEEKTKVLKENRDKTYNELKKLLLTEVQEENKQEEEKEKTGKLAKIEEESKTVNKGNKTNIPQNKIKEVKGIANAVSKYADSHKRENNFEKNYDLNYYDYMKKQKEIEEAGKKENFIQKNIKCVGENPLLAKYSQGKQVNLNQDEVYRDEDPYPSLENLDFEKENYDKVAFRYYGKDVLKSLFEIDKKLEALNPAHKNFSTKNDLKSLKENYKKNATKASVKKPAISNIPYYLDDKYAKTKLKKEDDYTNHNADIRFRRELKSAINEIDTEILMVQRKEVNREKIETFIEAMNKSMYPTPEEREKAVDFKIPEEAVFDKMEKQFGECDAMLKLVKQQIAEKEKKEKEEKVIEVINKPEVPTAEEIENQRNLDLLLKQLESEEKKTKNLICNLEGIEDKLKEEDQEIDKQLDDVQEMIRKNEQEYDEIIRKYEQEIERKYEENEDEKDQENCEEKNLEQYYKIYGVDEIIHHDYANEANFAKINFQKEMDKINERMQIFEKMLNEEEK